MLATPKILTKSLAVKSMQLETRANIYWSEKNNANQLFMRGISRFE